MVVFVIRNVITCLISTYISAWFRSQGLQKAFGELVGVACIILSMWVGICLFGRKLRSFTSSFGPMRRLRAR